MILRELNDLLASHSGGHFQIRLPDGSAVPQSFHITEVGRIRKTFLDCGGTLRDITLCQLQVWVGGDDDHRIETGKMAAILKKAHALLPDDGVPVEIEYEDRVISQYTISDHEITGDAVILNLAHKHTECLAPELCGLPALPAAGRFTSAAPRCGPSGCC
jgi:hypothetical protein